MEVEILKELAKVGVRELKQVGKNENEFIDQLGRRIKFKRTIENGFIKWTFEFI